ncbi:LysR family transcriptional regulator [Paenibacillus sp. HN-1]|uniref:LysR family transcriptional regulator n=1 Tax=Paenibacillus TaxID=44249 RepID=UPI001CA8440A|nr:MULTISPECIES: LysR family transcriptional regulator [Paenibacillus]MBY9078810.1 LysR family transcriptional regulator [Paenibacillus sp. CGMCC 1.18879]MBY9088030.1 LysR family transcriptional regulator [Paenibacillus sinensis]
MELTQLEYFLTVVRHQHLTKAAEELRVTQSALSHAISRLESELGVPLFDRTGRNIRVNAYGLMFAKRVEQGLMELKAGVHEIEAYTNPDTGIVNLSYLNILGAEQVPRLIKRYQLEKPGIRFELTQGNYDVINAHLEKGFSDLMITSKEATDGQYEWLSINTVPLYLAVPDSHSFASRGSISLREITGEPFIGMNKNCGLKQTLAARFENTSFELNAMYDAEDLITVAGFISAGLGVSVLPKMTGLQLDGISWLPIEEKGWMWEIGLKWRTDRYLPPAARGFLDFIRNSSPDQLKATPPA